jgi:hypothetical protein
MAFSNTMSNKVNLGNGMILEYGVWDGASVTTGTITADTTVQPEITKIIAFGAANDADNAVICALDAGDNKLKLTFTGNDTGDYWFIGEAR